MLTFHNAWPTLLVHWPGEVSIELIGVLLLLAAWRGVRGALPRHLLFALAAVFVLGTLGRYGEVTAPALYGRDVNLYWDLQHAASLAGMLVSAVPAWLLVAVIVGVGVLLALLYLAALWSLRTVALAFESARLGAATSIAAAAMLCWFTLQRFDAHVPRVPQFSIPVSQTYAQQMARLADVLEGSARRELPPSPQLSSTMTLAAGSDVIVVFLESYGRVAYDRPEFFRTLSSARGELDRAARDTGRGVVSGFIESPTFGGGSWLAHLSFLSGVEVRDPGRAGLLMTQARRTFGTELARHGYRRVALMPGLKKNWPEGAFYGFDRIYDDAALDYRGPAFGWWRIPDQFSLAKLDALEAAPHGKDQQPRQPLFLFFPTISTHAPFRPTPPYQADWARLLQGNPFDPAALEQSLPQRPTWNDMGASYVGAMDYTLRTLAGYLRTQRGRDLVMIILGDHQPPAFVAGEHASWDVPVHVIAGKAALLRTLQHCGFRAGVVPAAATLGPMHQLAPVLLSALGAPAQTACTLGRPPAS